MSGANHPESGETSMTTSMTNRWFLMLVSGLLIGTADLPAVAATNVIVSFTGPHISGQFNYLQSHPVKVPPPHSGTFDFSGVATEHYGIDYSINPPSPSVSAHDLQCLSFVIKTV